MTDDTMRQAFSSDRERAMQETVARIEKVLETNLLALTQVAQLLARLSDDVKALDARLVKIERTPPSISEYLPKG